MNNHGQWKQELIFVKRDANGVIVAMSEQTPAGFVDEDRKIVVKANVVSQERHSPTAQ